MINTPNDLILQALKRSGVIGVGQTPSFEDQNDAFDALNGMIAQWSQKRWLVWALDDIACVSTGAISYPIGLDQITGFNTPRPDRLEAAYVRLLPVNNGQPFDRTLTIIDSHEDYASLSLKHLATYPNSIYYDSQFPVGQIFPYPVAPMANYELHILVKNQILPFPSLATPINPLVPPEYMEALAWNLAARLRPSYGLAADEQVIALAKMALNTIRQSNLQVPTLDMPSAIPRNGGSSGDFWFAGLVH